MQTKPEPGQRPTQTRTTDTIDSHDILLSIGSRSGQARIQDSGSGWAGGRGAETRNYWFNRGEGNTCLPLPKNRSIPAIFTQKYDRRNAEDWMINKGRATIAICELHFFFTGEGVLCPRRWQRKQQTTTFLFRLLDFEPRGLKTPQNLGAAASPTPKSATAGHNSSIVTFIGNSFVTMNLTIIISASRQHNSEKWHLFHQWRLKYGCQCKTAVAHCALRYKTRFEGTFVE